MGSTCDYSKISINALNKSKHILSEALNIYRVVPNDEGVPKDWRGLLHYIGEHEKIYIGESISRLEPNPTGKVLQIWQSSKELAETYNVESLLKYLKLLDRWDIFDDIQEILDKDIQFYVDTHNKGRLEIEHKEEKWIEEDSSVLTLNDEHYDAYILYHEQNEEDGIRVIQELESRQLRCCTTDRDLLTVQFKHDAITKLISERCTKLVILVTKSFLESGLFTYILKYTQALGIEKWTNKIVPLRFDDCVLPGTLVVYNMIDFTGEDRFKNRWDRLYYSIKQKTACTNNKSQSIKITESINSRPMLDVAGSSPHCSPTSSDEANTNSMLSNSISNAIDDQERINDDTTIKSQKDDEKSKKNSIQKKKKKFKDWKETIIRNIKRKEKREMEIEIETN